jgi:AraC-like DNA-binding protein
VKSLPIHPLLSRCVQALVVQDSSERGVGTVAPYRVLPKPYPVMGFQYQGRLRVLRGGRDLLLERAGITGLQRESRWFRGEAETRSVLVMLQPAGAWALFGVSLNELADAHVGLADHLPPREIHQLEERIAASESSHSINTAVQSFLLRALAQARQSVHPAITAATSRLMMVRGNMRVETLAAQLGVSKRQLERLFRLQVGVSPREFASLARFVWTADQVILGRPIIDIAAEAGYADQAHLIRTFVKRTGQTPGRFTPEDVADVAFVQSRSSPTV